MSKSTTKETFKEQIIKGYEKKLHFNCFLSFCPAIERLTKEGHGCRRRFYG